MGKLQRRWQRCPAGERLAGSGVCRAPPFPLGTSRGAENRAIGLLSLLHLCLFCNACPKALSKKHITAEPVPFCVAEAERLLTDGGKEGNLQPEPSHQFLLPDVFLSMFVLLWQLTKQIAVGVVQLMESGFLQVFLQFSFF